MNEFSSQQYTQDEVNRIIRRALKLNQEDTISHQDLIATAREIGIDPKILQTAIEQEQQEFKKARIRQARLKQQKMAFYSHLWSYLIITAVLLLTNIFTPGPWWFQWAVLGWGIGMAFHFKAIYFPGSKPFDRRMKKRHRSAHFRMCEK
jgi:hypothetical protein